MKNHWTNGLNVKELMLTYKPRNIVELGALNGENTIQYLALRNELPFRMCTISTGDARTAFQEVVEAHNKQMDYQWIDGISYEVIPKLRDGVVDFCSIDTDHRSEVLQKELDAILPKLFPRCIIVIHDTVSFPELHDTVVQWVKEHDGFMVLRETVESCGAMAISRLLDIKYTL